MHVQEGAELDTAVAQVLDSLVETSGVRRAGLALSEGGGRRLRFTASDRDVRWVPGEPVELEWCHIDAYEDVPLTTVLRTGTPVIGGLELLEERYPGFAQGLREQGVAAVAALPLTIDGATWGGVVLYYDEPQRFGPHQVELLRSGAARATVELATATRVLPDEAESSGSCAGDGQETVCIDVEPESVSVALARRWARRCLQDWKVDDDVLDTAVLCLSELVTNVVMHAATRAHIELRRETTAVVVTVRDSGAARQARASAPEPDPLLVHGRGLQLVAALADAWGSETGAGGTTVWCSFGTGPGGDAGPA
jgi:anti-sigma regulatory factor (Ser/Thr protein kinase)